MHRLQDAYYHQSNCLSFLTSVLDPGVEVNVSRKLCSNPKRLDLRIVQPVTVQLVSIFGWLNICHAPATTILRGHRDPLVIGRDQKVWGIAREDGGLHNAHERVQKG
jgi:hypothetical protein